MPLGKSIELYLMDGTSSGPWEARLSNWNCAMYRFSRRDLVTSTDIPELRTPGVCFLFGLDQETGRKFVYVGEGENLRQEVLRPHSFERSGTVEEDYWTEAILLVSLGQSLDRVKTRYLQSRFCSLIQDGYRYQLKNEATPELPQLLRSDRDSLEQVVLNTGIIMPALGHRVFEQTPSRPDALQALKEEKILHLAGIQGKSIHATGSLADDGFWVFQGSRICLKTSPSLSPAILDLRANHAPLLDEDGILQEDLCFPSPSCAASFVCGQNVNGLHLWRDRDGISLGDLNRDPEAPDPAPEAAPQTTPPQTESVPPSAVPADVLQIVTPSLTAYGKVIPSGFLVLKGSQVTPAEQDSCPPWTRRLRHQLLESGAIQDWTFTCDTAFNSPSSAASCIFGSSRSGPLTWVTQNGIFLKYLSAIPQQTTALPASAPESAPDSPLSQPSPLQEEALHLVSRRLIAYGRQTDRGFQVLKGSQISETETDSCPAKILQIRQRLLRSGLVRNWILAEDVMFTSPSSAASCIFGHSRNGRLCWANSDGIFLQNLLSSPSDAVSRLESELTPAPVAEPSAPENILRLDTDALTAHGRLTEDGFEVLAGSQISPDETGNCPASIQKLRRQLLDRIMVQDGVFSSDYLFEDALQAAACLLGCEQDGCPSWISEEGTLLKDLPIDVSDSISEPELEPENVSAVPIQDSPIADTALRLDSRNLLARGREVENGFEVLAGSQIRLEESFGCPPGIRKLRSRLFESGQIEDGILTKNLLFENASAAAAFVFGCPRSRKQSWLAPDGPQSSDTAVQTVPSNVPEPAWFSSTVAWRGILYLTGMDLHAYGRVMKFGFKVLTGSQFRTGEADNCPLHIRTLRHQLLGNYTIEDGVFVKDYLFKGPAEATAVIFGCEMDPGSVWESRDGVSLRQIFENPPDPASAPEATLSCEPEPVSATEPPSESGTGFLDSPAPDPEYDLTPESEPAPDQTPGPFLPPITGLLHIAGRNITALGQFVPNGFQVLKGSQIRDTEAASCPSGIRLQRQQMIADGSIQDYVLTHDILFKSPSGAAAFVLGRSSSGNVEWLDPNGTRLKDLLQGLPSDVIPHEASVPETDPIQDPDPAPEPVPEPRPSRATK